MADAIIVPGRGVYPDGTLFIDPKSRIRQAVALLNDGVAPLIIMSGGYSYRVENKTNVSEAKAMKDYAVSLGADPKSIMEEDGSTHTLANAYFCKKTICEPKGWREIVVVSSSDHMRRIVYVFTKVFGDDYKFTFVKSRRVISPFRYLLQVAHEKASLRLTKRWLDDVEDGDDQSIRRILLSQRPDDTVSRATE